MSGTECCRSSARGSKLVLYTDSYGTNIQTHEASRAQWAEHFSRWIIRTSTCTKYERSNSGCARAIHDESSGAQQRVPAEDLLPAVALHLLPVLLLVRAARLRSYARATHTTLAHAHSRTNAEATAPNRGKSKGNSPNENQPIRAFFFERAYTKTTPHEKDKITRNIYVRVV